jgi:hypothetical protein
MDKEINQVFVSKDSFFNNITNDVINSVHNELEAWSQKKYNKSYKDLTYEQSFTHTHEVNTQQYIEWSKENGF